MSDNYEMRMEYDLSTMANFSRQKSEVYSLLAEFIDNSFQSYIDHQEELIASGMGPCVVDISVSGGSLSIADNAYGMDKEGIRRAISFKPSDPNRDARNLGKYGLGMKRSILCFGPVAIARFETKLYRSPSVCTFLISNEKIRANDEIVIVSEEPADNAESHYTRILIANCDKSLLKSVVDTKTRTMLSRLYSRFLEREEHFKILLQGEFVKPFNPSLIEENGIPRRISISEEDSRFMYEGKEYTFSGWIGAVPDMKREENVGIDILAPSGRAIESGHRTRLLLGAKSMPPYRMITGQLMTGEGDWTPGMDKVGFALGEEFWKQFDLTLKDIPQFSDFARWLYGYRVRTNKPQSAPEPISKVFSFGSAGKCDRPSLTPLAENAGSDCIEERVDESPRPIERTENLVLDGERYRLVATTGTNAPADFISLDTSDSTTTTIRLNLSVFNDGRVSLSEDSDNVLRKLAFAIALARNRATKQARATPDDLIRELNTVLRKGIL